MTLRQKLQESNNMLGIKEISLLPPECGMAILQFVDDFKDSDIDDMAIFVMDAVNCSFDALHLEEDELRAAISDAFDSDSPTEKARAVLAVLRLGIDSYEDDIRRLVDSQDKYKPALACDMRDMLIAAGCEEEFFDAPQAPDVVEKLQELAKEGHWTITVDDNDEASLRELAKWALNLLTI